MDTPDLDDQMVFLEVDSSRWADMEKLFESRGGPKNCWCMVWRGTAKDRSNKESCKTAIKQFVDNKVPIGILGYSGDQPIAWCSIAPRSTYRKLGGVDDPEEDPETVWSLVCFFITRNFRGKGVMKRLIQVAVEHSHKRGAKVIEAYPVDLDSPSYRFMGFVPVFEESGFIEVGSAGKRRHVMRLTIS